MLPQSVFAHALAQTSIPAQGSTISQAPAEVSIVFGETPDAALSSITVVDSSGSNVTTGAAHAIAGQPQELAVPLKPHLPDGVYTVTWRTVSSVDGHLAAGSFAFGVGVAASSVPVGQQQLGASAPTPFTIAARALLFLGLIISLGALVLGLFAFGTLPGPLRTVVAAASVLAALSTAAVIASGALAAGVGWGEIFSSSLGRTLIVRSIPAALLLGCGLTLLRGRRLRELGALAAVAAVAAMVADVINSHAAAQSPQFLNEVAQWLHIAAVSIWIGGLVALLVLLRGSAEEHHEAAVRRLSTLAAGGLVVVAATGGLRAVVEVQSWANLVTTSFGVLVLVKIGLILLLAALGAINRWGNIPRLPAALRAIRRVAGAEVVAGVAAIAVAAALVNVAPPAEYASAQQTPAQPAAIVATGSDAATTVRLRLTVTPGTAGFNTFVAEVTDYDSGAPVPASAVTLQFTQPFRPALATSTLVLAPQGNGRFQARGGNLSPAGEWQVAAFVQQASGAAEVHLLLVTDEPAPPVTVTKAGGGLPTLYTAKLSPVLSAQVYLDPDRAGKAEFHVTFFDTKGNEAAIPAVSVGITPQGGAPTLLVTRPLDDVGHYVADLTVPSGPSRFDIIATTASGQSVAGYLTISPGG